MFLLSKKYIVESQNKAELPTTKNTTEHKTIRVNLCLLNKQFIADLILKFLYIQNLKLKNEG
jgi:hypothetical protein